MPFSGSSARLGESPNPPPFTGQVEHVFRVDQSPNPDQHAVVFYKDVVDEDFNVEDFDVSLTAVLAPVNIGAEPLTFVWERISGPDSGELLSSSSLSATFRNPKKGGVYRFRLTVRCGGTDIGFGEANLVLPLAGAEMKYRMESCLSSADDFINTVKSRFVTDYYRNTKNLEYWFVDSNNGDFVGRPDNAANPSIWYYGQVSNVPDANYRLGAVCTWNGVPVRLSKLTNFFVAYSQQKLDVNYLRAKAALILHTGYGTLDGATANESWDVGWDYAKDGGDYNAKIDGLVDFIWNNEEDTDKSRKLWPNSNIPDNLALPPQYNLNFDMDRQYSVPGCLFLYQ